MASEFCILNIARCANHIATYISWHEDKPTYTLSNISHYVFFGTI